MSAVDSSARRRSFSVVAAAWVLILSALVVIDHARLMRSTDARAASAERSQVAELKEEIAVLQATVSAIERQPAPVRAAQYEATEQAQDARLGRIETSVADVVHVADIGTLEEQLTHLAAEVWRLRHPLPPHPRPVVHERAPNPGGVRQPAEVPPPFIVLGTELRGGEEFLTLAPREAQSLFEVRVLRPGEADGNWTLEAIEGRTAVFVTANRLQRVPIP